LETKVTDNDGNITTKENVVSVTKPSIEILNITMISNRLEVSNYSIGDTVTIIPGYICNAHSDANVQVKVEVAGETFNLESILESGSPYWTFKEPVKYFIPANVSESLTVKVTLTVNGEVFTKERVFTKSAVVAPIDTPIVTPIDTTEKVLPPKKP